MQLFSDNLFFIWLVVLTLPAIWLGAHEQPIKYYGAAVTLFFVWMAMGNNLKALAYLIGFLIYTFVLIQIYLKVHKTKGRNAKLYYLFLGLAILPLALNKVFIVAHDPHDILRFMGISYMTFKSAQIVIEIYDGLIESVDAFEYAYLLLFFPALSSGPIDRSRRFNDDLHQVMPKAEYLDLVGTGLFRILRGLVYKKAIATGFYQLMIWFGMGHSLRGGLIYMYTYGFYLFFDFAGYSDMAVGASYLFGIKTPDNFNKPFVSVDIKEFWDRWHITLSHWFRDFVFSRITMSMIRKKRFKNKLTRASVAFIINMGIMGCWHGLTSYYIAYGLYHGVLLSATEIFQKKSKFYKRHKKDKRFKAVSWLVTFNLVMFGFLIFSGRLNVLLHL
ncbi:D-alanyl-lipoteichoic acid biosynthesis protein DltB [Pseudoramibacter alactolyticus]|uniref:D-alanyl-lipoteichoic acid biosynthesis protein DltB n=1 Tax=Pseudoramibacter alactolyticus TaxID=113287 RepID=UPI002352D20E|nr:D-alanyl-lipoteichoic acid biosynthesis protein DltB [Pseudoramibacter alactolyticus]MBM6968066.1 D-alanyl-lipoteichoic acid biosynthesis protein DltB [Pseudoramibacter alactolyticus]